MAFKGAKGEYPLWFGSGCARRQNGRARNFPAGGTGMPGNAGHDCPFVVRQSPAAVSPVRRLPPLARNGHARCLLAAEPAAR